MGSPQTLVALKFNYQRLAISLGVLLVMGVYVNVGTDSSNGPFLALSRDALVVIVNVALLLLIVPVLLVVLRIRGRWIVGGDGWIAEYQWKKLRPLASKVVVADPGTMTVETVRLSESTSRADSEINFFGDGRLLLSRSFHDSDVVSTDIEERLTMWKERNR